MINFLSDDVKKDMKRPKGGFNIDLNKKLQEEEIKGSAKEENIVPPLLDMTLGQKESAELDMKNAQSIVDAAQPFVAQKNEMSESIVSQEPRQQEEKSAPFLPPVENFSAQET